MGSAPSAEKPPEKEKEKEKEKQDVLTKEQKLKAKIRMMGSLQKHANDDSRNVRRRAVHNLVRDMKMERRASEMEIEAEKPEDSLLRFQRTFGGSHEEIQSPLTKHDMPNVTLKHLPEIFIPPHLQVIMADAAHPHTTDSDHVCLLCEQPCYGQEAFPCRVCSRVFHRECLERSGKCRAGDLKFLARARTNIGWSCYECDNISAFLLPNEVRDMISVFERYDVDKDSYITMKEYLEYKKEKYLEDEGETLPEEEYHMHELRFKLIDVDGSGRIDWWEFLNHETPRHLIRRDPEELIEFLTPKERSHLAVLFKSLDRNGDGRITEGEARMAFHGWYSSLMKKTENSKATKELEMHVELNTQIIMSADERDTGVVTWDEFIRQQALFFISSRPNQAYFK